MADENLSRAPEGGFAAVDVRDNGTGQQLSARLVREPAERADGWVPDHRGPASADLSWQPPNSEPGYISPVDEPILASLVTERGWLSWEAVSTWYWPMLAEVQRDRNEAHDGWRTELITTVRADVTNSVEPLAVPMQGEDGRALLPDGRATTAEVTGAELDEVLPPS